MSLDRSLGLIFGGCCSNVFALEAIIKNEPDSGLLITTSQFFLVALFTLPTQIERRSQPPQRPAPKPDSNGQVWLSKEELTRSYTHHDPHPSSTFVNVLFPYRIRLPQIPLIRLINASLLFCLVNMLNNWAFAFDISVPMHIILRSFGSVITLVVGWYVGKQYGTIQVLGVMGLTVGVIMAAWADAAEKGADLSLGAPTKANTTSFTAGLVVLFVAQLLGAIMGVYTESTYARHGRHWREILFYTHFLGALFSLALLPSLQSQLQRLTQGPPITLPTAALSRLQHYLYLAYLPLPLPLRQRINTTIKTLHSVLHRLPLPHTTPTWLTHRPSKSLALLLLNSLTQYTCISGVNQLGAATSAVTVTVVLNIRKLASFLLSCFLFGNTITTMMGWGAGVVFASGAVYGFGGAWGKRNAVRDEQSNSDGVGGRGERGRETARKETAGGGCGREKSERKPFDSLAITKGYATAPASPTHRKVWKEDRQPVAGVMNEPYAVAGVSETDGAAEDEGPKSPGDRRDLGDGMTKLESGAIVRSDGTMSPRGAWGRGGSGSGSPRGSFGGTGEGQSPEMERRGWASSSGYDRRMGMGMAARLNSDGSMTRR